MPDSAERAHKIERAQSVANDTGRGPDESLIDKIARSRSLPIEAVQTALRNARESMLPYSRRISVTENGVGREYVVTRHGYGIIKTTRSRGRLRVYDFAVDDDWEHYEAIVCSDVDPASFEPTFSRTGPLFLRIDSGCVTGQVYHDRTCECRQQLQLAMSFLARHGDGLIIRIPTQDGRGKGRPFKQATLTLQDVLHIDTVEAATLLAGSEDIDTRTYAGAIAILKFFDVPPSRGIAFATNNPKKECVLLENGLTIEKIVPVVVRPTRDTKLNLEAKKQRLGHRL